MGSGLEGAVLRDHIMEVYDDLEHTSDLLRRRDRTAVFVSSLTGTMSEDGFVHI